MGEGTLFVLWAFFTIFALVIYHKIFAVYYFNLSRGIMSELFGAVCVGGLLAALSIYLWWLTAIIIVVVGLVTAGKVTDSSMKKVIMIVFVVIAIIISIVGISAKMKSASESAWNFEIEQQIENQSLS